MNGSIFSMTRYMIGLGFRNLGHTPVPQLPLSYPPPSPRCDAAFCIWGCSVCLEEFHRNIELNFKITPEPPLNESGLTQMSRLMGKQTICIGENKDADQLRGYREADQRICFRYSDSTIPLLLKSEISSF